MHLICLHGSDVNVQCSLILKKRKYRKPPFANFSSWALRTIIRRQNVRGYSSLAISEKCNNMWNVLSFLLMQSEMQFCMMSSIDLQNRKSLLDRDNGNQQHQLCYYTTWKLSCIFESCICLNWRHIHWPRGLSGITSYLEKHSKIKDYFL